MLLVFFPQVGIIRFGEKGEALCIFMYAFMGKCKDEDSLIQPSFSGVTFSVQ